MNNDASSSVSPAYRQKGGADQDTVERGIQKTNCERLTKYKTQTIWRETDKIRSRLDRNNKWRLQVIRRHKNGERRKGLGPEEIHRLA